MHLFQFQVCRWRRRHKTHAIHNETIINILLNACNIDVSNEINFFHFAQITASYLFYILLLGIFSSLSIYSHQITAVNNRMHVMVE